MHTLSQALSEHDLIVLRVIGEWWELDLTGSDKNSCVQALSGALAQLDLATELTYLPVEEAEALRTLAQAGGRLPVATFSRQFGAVRQMGPAALERDEPWFDPVSAAEDLWYRGLIYTGFAETAEGMTEFVYMPTELQSQFGPGEAVDPPNNSEPVYEPLPEAESEPEKSLEAAATAPKAKPVRRAGPILKLTPTEPPESFASTTTQAVDDMTTLLGIAQNNGIHAARLAEVVPFLVDADRTRLSLLVQLGLEMGLLREVGAHYRVSRQALAWLQHSREAQLRALGDGWSNCSWNELRHIPDIECEGTGWRNDPLLARTALLDAITHTEAWFSIADLLELIKETDPDFQRPNGNYDTWYIRDVASGEYLSGFEHWEEVEGRVLRYLLQRPLVWLGMVEATETHFRLTYRALDWLNNVPPVEQEAHAPLVVQPDGTLVVSARTRRIDRFQAARVSEMLPLQPDKPFVYRLTPSALTRARQQGIKLHKVVQFLERAGERPLPASTKRALERWGEEGVEASIEQAIVLRVKSAEILDKLRSHPKTRPLIGESLGELAVVVNAGHWDELCRVAAQLGLLLDTPGSL